MIELIKLSQQIAPGEAIVIDESVIRKCAQQNLSSLMFDTVREEDIKDVVRKVNEDWDDYKLKKNHGTNQYTFERLK